MHPHTPATPGTPTEPEPIAQVNTGMQVFDASGEEIGTVSAVQMPGTGGSPDVAPEDVDRLRRTGYVRIDTKGLLSKDTYVEAAQVAQVDEVDGGVVTLNVTKDQLLTA
jgi:hypothetical protein